MFVALVLASGCGEKEPANQLLFWVTDVSPTGLEVPDDLEAIQLTVWSIDEDGGMTEAHMNGWPLRPTGSTSDAGVTLPASLAVLPRDPDMPRGSVLVELEALRNTDELVLRYSLITNFGVGLVEHDLPIDPTCFGMFCSAGERCQGGDPPTCVRF